MPRGSVPVTAEHVSRWLHGCYVDQRDSTADRRAAGEPGLQLLNRSRHDDRHGRAVDTTTADGFGVYTEAVLVTKDLTGAAAAYPRGRFDLQHDQPRRSCERLLRPTSRGWQQDQDTLYTPLGNFVIPVTFDAALVETSRSRSPFRTAMTSTPPPSWDSPVSTDFHRSTSASRAVRTSTSRRRRHAGTSCRRDQHAG